MSYSSTTCIILFLGLLLHSSNEDQYDHRVRHATLVDVMRLLIELNNDAEYGYIWSMPISKTHYREHLSSMIFLEEDIHSFILDSDSNKFSDDFKHNFEIIYKAVNAEWQIIKSAMKYAMVRHSDQEKKNRFLLVHLNTMAMILARKLFNHLQGQEILEAVIQIEKPEMSYFKLISSYFKGVKFDAAFYMHIYDKLEHRNKILYRWMSEEMSEDLTILLKKKKKATATLDLEMFKKKVYNTVEKYSIVYSKPGKLMQKTNPLVHLHLSADETTNVINVLSSPELLFLKDCNEDGLQSGMCVSDFLEEKLPKSFETLNASVLESFRQLMARFNGAKIAIHDADGMKKWKNSLGLIQRNHVFVLKLKLLAKEILNALKTVQKFSMSKSSEIFIAVTSNILDRQIDQLKEKFSQADALLLEAKKTFEDKENFHARITVK